MWRSSATSPWAPTTSSSTARRRGPGARRRPRRRRGGDRGRLEDRDRLESGGVGAGIAFSFEEMTLVLPREKLGERFRFAAAFYQFPSNDGGGQHLRSDAGPALKADVFVDRFLAIDVGPNGGAWTLPDDSDRDRDGASDRQEAGAGTDPFDEDTDGDLLLDGFELEFSFDPLDDAFEDSSDPDDDNLETLVEQSLGTDPLNADTDGDGLSDFDEPELDGEVGGGDFGIRLKGFIGSPSALGTSPARFDSDGDGLDDGTEVQVLGSDPTEADTDEDGLDDGEEELRGLSFDGFDTDSGGASDGAEALVDGTNPSLGADDVEPVFLGGSGFLPAAVAVDSGGAAHVGWIRSGRLRYAMVSPSGAVRIADTELSATASAGRPAVALDTQDRLHVAWTAPAGSRRTIRHLLLDPALDDQDGSPASAAAIVVSPSQDIGSGGTFSSRDPALTLDGAGRVHAVWVDPFDGDEIHYSRLSAAGSVELRDLVLFLGGDSVRDLGARGHGDAVQLLWTQEAPFFGRSQPVFALLGAATAAVEIDVTPLLPVDDESEIQGLAIAGGSGAESTVVFHHREIERGTGAFCGAIRLLRLDPSVDDRDGSPADPDSLARSSRTLQRCLATRETYDPTAGLSAGGELTVAWLDEDFISTTARMSRFAADGTRLQGAVAISRFRGLVEEIPIAVGAGDSHVFLVWTSTSGQLRIRVVTP